MDACSGTVVVIDDEEYIRNYLAEVLSLEGYECKCFQESLAALAYLEQAEVPPDLVMTDIRMPDVDGLEVLRRIHAFSPELPVVLISGIYELAIALDAVQSGAADYLFKPARPADVLSLVARHVGPGAKASEAAARAALARFLAQYESPAGGETGEDQSGRMLELFQALGLKHYETMQHSMRVAAYAALLGERHGLPLEQLKSLRLGALLHDIGKIAIPRNVLLKRGELNAKEWEVMRTHPHIGFQLLAPLPGMGEAAEVVYAHHERYDGSGYPRALRGEGIPIGARIFSVVDAVDAITTDRCYRPARSLHAACQELRRCSGTQFDPSLAELFVSLPTEELRQIQDRFVDAN